MAQPAPVVIRRAFPWSEKIDGREVTYRLMTREDRDAIVALARSLKPADLSFLRMDITDPNVVDEWVINIEHGRTITVLAESVARIIGYGSLHHNELMWTSHLGELRVLVREEDRASGIGRRLVSEIFHIANEMHLERVICQIPASQARVRKMFEGLGFQPEALLPQWLMARDGSKHDLLIMSHRMGDFG